MGMGGSPGKQGRFSMNASTQKSPPQQKHEDWNEVPKQDSEVFG